MKEYKIILYFDSGYETGKETIYEKFKNKEEVKKYLLNELSYIKFDRFKIINITKKENKNEHI